MFIKKFKDCQEIIAGDSTILRETLSPLHDGVESRYSLAHAKLPVGAKSVPHAMKTTEAYFIVRGMGIMHIDNEQQKVEKYDTVYIPPHGIQHLENIGQDELEFICIVDPAWRVEDELTGS